MSEPTAHSGKPDHSGAGSSRIRARWLWIVGVVTIVGAISAALWWPSSPTPEATVAATPSDQATLAPSDEPASSEASSPTPTPTPTPSDAPAFTDVNGRWCPTSPADWEESCFTVDLPTVVYDDHPDFTEYVYPSSAETAGDPSTFVYDFAPSLGDCWEAAVDGYPAMSGATFYFCPAGATPPHGLVDLTNDPSVDRLLITQAPETYAYHREGA